MPRAERPPAPFVAPPPARWREKYATPGHAERPLRLLLIGHNPSEHAWASGHFYSNPTNRMWILLRESGLIPSDWTAGDDDRAPLELGIGFTDLGTEPGNDANAYPRAVMRRWRDDLFVRLSAHARRAGAAPALVAFTGKRQWAQLFDPPLKRTETGAQPPELRPEGWPFDGATEVWILPSSSGRAAYTREQRFGPYRALARRLERIPWSSATATRKGR